MEHTERLLRTTALWVASLGLVLSSAADLVLLNVAVVTGQLAGPEGADLFAGAAWIAAVLSAVLLLIGGLRLRRLDRPVVWLLAWGSLLAALFVGIRIASSGMAPTPTAIGMIPRLGLSLGALLLVTAMRAGTPTVERRG